MVGKLINGFLNAFGYHIGKHQSVQYLISRNKYRWLQSREINTIVDIGANNGQFADFIHQVMPGVSIYSFEPLAMPFEQLVELSKTIHTLHCFNYAIGATNGEVEINENDFSASSSILPMGDLHVSSFPFTKNSIVKAIPIRTLDSFIPEIHPVKSILLKIDVQGFELEVLKGAEKFVNMVDVIIVETSFFELYKTQPLFRDIYEYLLKKGFSYCGNFDQINSASTGEVLQADAIFIRQTV
ncbi:MAG: FkbM family methyltransferase [Bacteroidota bacterium]|jgi:FkbM family methyltransferase